MMSQLTTSNPDEIYLTLNGNNRMLLLWLIGFWTESQQRVQGLELPSQMGVVPLESILKLVYF